MVIMKDVLAYFTLAYIRGLKDKGVPENQLYIPEVISHPLHFFCQKMNMKYGLSSGISYNWNFKEKPENMEKLNCKDHIDIKWHLTPQLEEERLLMGFSATVSYFLFQTIRLAFDINKIIEI